MDTLYVLGIDSLSKPYPKLVLSNIEFLRSVIKNDVLDIGAGHGRFIRLFKEHNIVCRRYIAVEPYKDFIKYIKAAAASAPFQVEIVDKTWQEVRDVLLTQNYDCIIAWDVGMYLDLRKVHGTESFREALIREIAEWIRHCKVLLLSFYPDKRGLPEINGYSGDRKYFRAFHEIVVHALELVPEAEMFARFHYQNYIIVNRKLMET